MSSTPLLVAEPPSDAEKRLVASCFFMVGSASDITFNAIVLSVAYLKQELGDDVLFLIGRAQFASSTLAMVLLFLRSARAPSVFAKRSLAPECRILTLSFSYMILLSAGLFTFAMRGWHLHRWPLFGAMLLNGAATGTCQSLVGSLAGMMTTFGGHPTAASAQMSGVGFGIVLPTLVQLLLLPWPLEPALATALLAVLAAGSTARGIVALRRLRTSDGFVRCRQNGLDILGGPVGVNAVVEPNYRKWMMKWMEHIGLSSLALALNFASLVYTGLLTPHVPASGSVPRPDLLPSLLLSATNAGDFIGRYAVTRAFQLAPPALMRPSGSLCRTCEENVPRQPCQRRRSFLDATSETVLQPRAHAALLTVRIALVIFCLAYCRWPGRIGTALGLGETNVPVLAAYSFAALLGGMISVALTQHAQCIGMASSGARMDGVCELPCPLASQIMWLSSVLGSTTGAVLLPVLLPVS